MAATRLISLHINKGKTIAQTLNGRTDYAKNPEKTEKGDLVTAYACDPMTVDEEFLLSKRQYQHITGRQQKSNVIAYQIRQSFKPGEVTAEEADQIDSPAPKGRNKAKIPTIRQLNQKYAQVLSDKKAAYAEYREWRKLFLSYKDRGIL